MKNFVLNSWSEGNYFDLWMFVHFISGLALGFGLKLINLSPALTLVLVFLLILLWELLEILSLGLIYHSKLMQSLEHAEMLRLLLM